MAKRILTAALALTAALMASTAQAGVIDYDMSPVCQAFLPKCQAQCKAPADFIFVCSAGSGPNGGPLVKCDCLQPAQPAGGNQRALLTLVDFPGAQKCKQKTWVNDCGTNLIATVTGSAANFTPTVTSAFGNPCETKGGIVIGPNKVAIAWPEYPLGITTSNPDGTISVQFGAFDDGSQECFAIYKIVQGSFMNGTSNMMGMAGLGGLAAAPGVAADGSAAAPAPGDIAALLNSAHPAGFSLLLSAAMLLLCLLASMHML